MLSPALRKAAILVTALDRDSADALLEQMPGEQAAQIRNALVELPDVNRTEQEEVLREFLSGKQGTMPELADEQGVELDLKSNPEEVSTKDVSSQRGDIIPRFQYLKRATPATLIRLLRDEHPQIVAVVIAHLPPAKAAAIIEAIDDKLQIDVLQRVAAIGDADPDSILQLDRELSDTLRKIEPAVQLHASGLQTVTAILAATKQRQAIVQRLSLSNSPLTHHVCGDATSSFDHRNDHTTSPSVAPLDDGTPLRSIDRAENQKSGSRDHRDPQLDHRQSSQQDQPPQTWPSISSPTAVPAEDSPGDVPAAAFRFNDIARLSDHDLTVLFRSAPPQVLLLSLLGADVSLVNRLMRQLPAADARKFRQRLNQTSPLSLQDIDEALRRLVALANELMANGRIRLNRPQFAAAA
jgi:flagellar motor switch protein FliG